MAAEDEKVAEKMETEEAKDETPKDETPKDETPKDEAENGDSEDKPMTAGESAAANPHYRVKISGLPRFYRPSDPLLTAFKKLLHQTLNLEFKYIRSPKKGNSWLYVTFFNQTDQERALKALKRYTWKGRTLICTLVVADVLKRKQEDTGPEASKRPRLDIPIEEQMLMSTIPYHSVSYQEQLSKKNEEAQCLFKWLAECMEKRTPQLIGYIDQEVKKNSRTRLPFKLDEVRSSPLIDGYRNKCEFRIGHDPQTKQVIVGYRVDNQEGDNIAVSPPDSLRHLPKEMLQVVKVFEKFVQDSPYPPQIQNHDTGVWRLLHVRINKAKQLMVVVLINPTVLTEENIAQLKKDLINFFTEGPAGGFNVVSLYLHTDNDVKTLGGGDKVKRPQGQLELLWGASHLEEQLLDLRLEIDPNFYFQNNTFGAEELYKAVIELAGVDAETTVLDLCCGSGGMGMMFAKHCKEVIGVEVMDVNVDDAKRLAAKNGLTNCEFLQGAVDDLFPELEAKLKGRKVVPILDPPRVGISAKLIVSLRKMTEAQRIIYVCSNHKLPSKNIMDLSLLNGENNEYKGTNPFFPARVIPVDISPHSLRCELVILLERLDMNKIPKPKRTPRPWGSRGSYGPERGRGSSRNFNQFESMKRDSLYPPPLRRNLYPAMRSRGREPIPLRPFGRKRLSPAYDFIQPHDFGPAHNFGPAPYDPPPPPRREFGSKLNRYSEFRRDVEEAIDSSYPPRGRVSQRLAMANAMLEQGLRLASEAMAEDDYERPPMPPPPPAPYRRGVLPRGMGGLPSRRSWDDMPPPPEQSWGSSWDGDDFETIPSRGNQSFGIGSRGYGRGSQGYDRGDQVFDRGNQGAHLGTRGPGAYEGTRVGGPGAYVGSTRGNIRGRAAFSGRSIRGGGVWRR